MFNYLTEAIHVNVNNCYKSIKQQLYLQELAATVSSQVINDICPQLSKFFVANTLDDVDSDTMHLFMNVVNTTISDVNPLN